MFGVSLAYAQSDSSNKNAQPPKTNGGAMQQGNKNIDPNQNQIQNQNQFQNQKPVIVGTVTDIDDETITVESNKKLDPNNKSNSETVTYTVDASDATFYEGSDEVDIDSVEEDDTIIIEGTISGTEVTATKIRIGELKSGNDFSVDGTGEPIVVGTVTDIDTDNETITIENNSDVTYTVDLSDATLSKDGETITISDISEDDVVLVQGEIDDDEITASSLTIQTKDNNGQGLENGNGQKTGFFKKIGSFFSDLFGF